jgi:hypothetical protein
MADFDWRAAAEELSERYDESTRGYREWQQLLAMLWEYRDRAESDEATRWFLEALERFLLAVDELGRGPTACRVFVSHQRRDVGYAERIAYMAHQQGFEYWLDIHDPVLRLANNAKLPPAAQSVLIAAIIEMALLNCSHAISVQTANAQGSRWVPYEFGRAKHRMLVSTQVASWFDNGIYATTTADYLKLGVCALSEMQVEGWLRTEHRPDCPPPRGAWTRPTPTPLPN